MKLIATKFPVIHQGQTVLVDVYDSSRNGTMSPVSRYYKYNGRWISLFERMHRGWEWSLTQELKLYFWNIDFKAIVRAENTLLNKIEKDNTWVGARLNIPLDPK